MNKKTKGLLATCVGSIVLVIGLSFFSINNVQNKSNEISRYNVRLVANARKSQNIIDNLGLEKKESKTTINELTTKSESSQKTIASLSAQIKKSNLVIADLKKKVIPQN